MGGRAYGHLCDFCHPARPALWDYPASSFVCRGSSPVAFASDGGWLACDRCADLIEAENRVGLVCVVPNHIFPHRDHYLIIDAFFLHRTGDRVPFG